MKTEMKAILASVVVIALCLAAVSGVTYSWFSDSEQVDVEINSGKIDLDMEIADFVVKSYGGAGKSLTAGSSVTTDLGGTVTCNTSNSSGQAAVTIKFENAAPGDSVSFSFYGTLTNTINVYYSEKSEITETSSSGLESPFTVTGLSESSTLYTPSNGTPNEIYSSGSKGQATVSMDTDIGNEYQGTSYTITILFQAYQANAPVVTDSVSTTIQGGNNSIAIYPSETTGGSMSYASIAFSGDSVNGQTLTVESFDNSDSNYTVNSGEAVLAGIDVTTSNGGSALDGTSTTVTFVIKGDLTGTELTLYHNGVISSIDVNSNKVYDTDTDTTTVTFTTSEGFSPYYVTANVAAMVDGAYYSTFEEAVSTATDGATITLLRDYNSTELMIISGKDVTIDLGNYSIESETNVFASVSNAVLTINGGTINSSGSPLLVQTGGKATVNDTVFNNGDSIYVGLTEYQGQPANTTNYPFTDTLTLNGVTVNSTYGSVSGFTNCNITINGGTFNDDIGGGLLTNGSYGLGGQNWTVNGATFNISVNLEKYSGEKGYLAVGIQCHNQGTWNISNCTFNMDAGVAISVRGGNVTVTDCEYNYSNTYGNTTTGKVQFTDVAIDLTVPHAIAAWYKTGTYGYEEGASLTVDGSTKTITVDGGMTYFDF